MFSSWNDGQRIYRPKGLCENIQSDVVTISTADHKTVSLLTESFSNFEEFVKFVKTCHGSRILQDTLVQLSNTGRDPKLTVLVKMLVEQKHIHDLVVDKFGNYFLQTLLSNVDEVSFNMLVVTLTEDSNRFSELCTHQFGSHVVQAAINMSGGNVRSSALLATSLCDNIESIAKHFLGSICLIHAIDSLVPSAGFKPIFSSHWQSLSLSRHGHVVMIHALDRYDDDFLYTVGDLTLNSLESFISDDFGYRVLLHLLKQLQVRRLSQTAFVSKLVGLIKFNAKYFRIIEYLVLNFPENVQVKKTLIPTIAKIVRKGFVPILSNN